MPSEEELRRLQEELSGTIDAAAKEVEAAEKEVEAAEREEAQREVATVVAEINRNEAAIPPKVPAAAPRTGLYYDKPTDPPAEMKIKDRMLKFFDPKDPDGVMDTHAIKQRYAAFSQAIAGLIDPGPERTVALRKLLESREAAIRAKTHPGG